MRNQMVTNFLIRSSLALAMIMTIRSPVHAQSAGSGNGSMMGGTMMNHTYGWMGGGVWIWTVIGVLVVVLLVVVISKLLKK